MNKTFKYSRLFAGVIHVGFRFYFKTFNEAQNAGKME